MKTERSIFVGIILALGLLLVVAPTFAQQPTSVCVEVQYFPDTGHNVCDQFLEFLNSRGGVEIFGFPITEAFVENGQPVQYFQRVRMEYHPELPAAYHVQLGLLGDSFAPPDKKARIDTSDKPKSNDPSRRYFPETGHTIEHSFYAFFSENGGLDNFGYPVTEYLRENGRLVQYFQRALMEWDPNQGIVLRNLGEMWVDQNRYLRQFTGSGFLFAQGTGSDPASATVKALQATASVRNAFAGPDGNQTVWVYVSDQKGVVVQGAEVTLIVPDRPGVPPIPMPPTDEFGHTQQDFSLQGLTPGELVILEARVVFRGLVTQARVFFLPWW